MIEIKKEPFFLLILGGEELLFSPIIIFDYQQGKHRIPLLANEIKENIFANVNMITTGKNAFLGQFRRNKLRFSPLIIMIIN